MLRRENISPSAAKSNSRDSLDLETVLEQVALAKSVHDLDEDLDS
mgnify:CR=1 FL=1